MNSIANALLHACVSLMHLSSIANQTAIGPGAKSETVRPRAILAKAKSDRISAPCCHRKAVRHLVVLTIRPKIKGWRSLWISMRNSISSAI